MQINPYLLFDGNCEEAFKFYAQVLGGKIEAMMPHTGTPMEKQTPPEWRDKIMHARMTVGDQILLASDAPPASYKKPQGFSVSLNIQDPAEAERVFHAIAESGTVHMPIQETFWAVKFGMFTDRFGIPWMINCDKPR
ncbi:MAG TPA: VOC family protein [Acidobacteriaceae bacterium]|jgi:PhnB protein|nr:VOC family protein [Acidobacteriaceae bacterium]